MKTQESIIQKYVRSSSGGTTPTGCFRRFWMDRSVTQVLDGVSGFEDVASQVRALMFF